jgi:hypothetical protein
MSTLNTTAHVVSNAHSRTTIKVAALVAMIAVGLTVLVLAGATATSPVANSLAGRALGLAGYSPSAAYLPPHVPVTKTAAAIPGGHGQTYQHFYGLGQ